MVTVYDVDATALINEAAKQLKTQKMVAPPAWGDFVKTGVSKERPPADKDWWYVRSASMLRKVYMNGPIGTNKLRRKYGSRKNRGYRPEAFFPGSGNITRKILQQLEAAKLLTFRKEGDHKGRMVSPAGKSFLDKIAGKLLKA